MTHEQHAADVVAQLDCGCFTENEPIAVSLVEHCLQMIWLQHGRRVRVHQGVVVVCGTVSQHHFDFVHRYKEQVLQYLQANPDFYPPRRLQRHSTRRRSHGRKARSV